MIRSEGELVLRGDNDAFLSDVISDVILLFFKTKSIVDAIRRKEFDDGSYYCLIGAMVGVEREKEKEYLKTIVGDMTVASVKGIHDFILTEMRETWDDLVKLCKKLYAQCGGNEDVVALAVFLMGTSDKTYSRVRVIENGNIVSECGDKIERPVPFFGTFERDFLFTISALHPDYICVESRDAIPERILRIIRAMGC